jgi:two-component system, chemotaxis family, protein-glutamate methylesterase/glutaminase
MERLVVIGASWGGLDALGVVLGTLPARFDAPVAIVQHRSALSGDDGLAATIDRSSALPVVEADDKTVLEPGTAYLAPADYHLLVERPGHLALSVDDRVNQARPSIDVLFESAAEAYGERVIGVLLTGANQDGAEGLCAIQERGGLCVVQDPATATRPRMPQSAIDAGAADVVAPLPAIAALLSERCARAAPGDAAVAK